MRGDRRKRATLRNSFDTFREKLLMGSEAISLIDLAQAGDKLRVTATDNSSLPRRDVETIIDALSA